MFEVAKMVLVVAVVFIASAGLFGLGLEMWIRNAKRWRLIMDAYAEGVRDTKKVYEQESR